MFWFTHGKANRPKTVCKIARFRSINVSHFSVRNVLNEDRQIQEYVLAAFVSWERVMSRFVSPLLLFVIASSALADDIHYQTTYLQDGQEAEFVILGETSRKARRISISGKLGGKGILLIDGNACSTNGFGDRNVCTHAYYPPLEVELKPLPEKDPLGLGRALYSVDTSGQIRNYTIRLVVPTKGNGSPRLLLNSHIAPDIVLRALTLEVGAGAVPKGPGYRKGEAKIVTIEDFAYTPEIVTIRVGDSVKWVNKDATRHSATREDDPAFDTELLSQGDEKTITFGETSDQLGFEYFCEPHPFMTGRVVVLPQEEDSEEAAINATGFQLARKSGCLKCHTVDEHKVGPAYAAIADRYRDSGQAHELLKNKILGGGKGNWSGVTGGVLMPPHARSLSDAEVQELITWLMNQ